MTITICPKCGSMNITTAGVCENCGWSPFAQVALCTRITGEMELKVSGKALLDDYKRLLFENKSLESRIVELEEIDKLRSESVSTLNQANANNEDEIELLEKRIAELEAEVTKGHELQDSYCDRIAELKAAQRWIPVSERLPDNWESVLTIDISKSTRDMVTAFYNPETSLWSTHFSCDLWVTHWMPLPEPPIVYGKVCEE